MSVPESEREEGRFSLLIRAEKLARYTITITANEKVFIPEYRRAITDDIVRLGKDIYIKLRTANDIRVRKDGKYQKQDWQERRRLQQEAIHCCYSLLALIDIAFRLFHLSSKRVKYWGGLVVEIRNRIQKWMESDNKRYSFE